jgi:hypothetical protein
MPLFMGILDTGRQLVVLITTRSLLVLVVAFDEGPRLLWLLLVVVKLLLVDVDVLVDKVGDFVLLFS